MSTPVKKEKYTESIGRRKTAIARVRLMHGKESQHSMATINDRSLATYFRIKKQGEVAIAPLTLLSLKEYHVSAHVEGGGLTAQSEAIRLGIARALLLINPIWRSKLKSFGFLKRDPRMVERKKPGSRKARRPQQWRKR